MLFEEIRNMIFYDAPHGPGYYCTTAVTSLFKLCQKRDTPAISYSENFYTVSSGALFIVLQGMHPANPARCYPGTQLLIIPSIHLEKPSSSPHKLGSFSEILPRVHQEFLQNFRQRLLEGLLKRYIQDCFRDFSNNVFKMSFTITWKKFWGSHKNYAGLSEEIIERISEVTSRSIHREIFGVNLCKTEPKFWRKSLEISRGISGKQKFAWVLGDILNGYLDELLAKSIK